MRDVIGFEGMTRIDWVVNCCGLTQDDAQLLLAFQYFLLTRRDGLGGEELQEAMEDWVDDLCGMKQEKLDGLLNILKEIK